MLTPGERLVAARAMIEELRLLDRMLYLDITPDRRKEIVTDITCLTTALEKLRALPTQDLSDLRATA